MLKRGVEVGPSKSKDKAVLRPTWQRAGHCLAGLSLGVGFVTASDRALVRHVYVTHHPHFWRSTAAALIVGAQWL